MCSKMPSDFSYEVRLYNYRRKCDVFACLTLHKNTHPLYLIAHAKSVALGRICSHEDSLYLCENRLFPAVTVTELLAIITALTSTWTKGRS